MNTASFRKHFDTLSSGTVYGVGRKEKNMAINVAINGFGRIGRAFLRAVMADSEAKKRIKIAAINLGPAPLDFIDIALKYDSLMGTMPNSVSFSDGHLHIDDTHIPIISEKTLTPSLWQGYNIDWVVESSGKFTKRDEAQQHIEAGARRVLITAPALDADATIIRGINDNSFDANNHTIISLGSCTTNAYAPLIKIINEKFGINEAHMTTIHSYTNDQMVVDGIHKDPRRARAAAVNIIPTKTGAAKVMNYLFPELAGKLNALAIRVPTPKVSVIDAVFLLKNQVSAEEINTALKHASTTNLKGILAMSDLPLVSSDFAGNSASSIVDTALTTSTGTCVKVIAWYDNEWGYSCRLKEFILHN